MYRNAFADEAADVRMTALMMEGRLEMPARVIAMTQGEVAASLNPVSAALSSLSSFEGTMRPIARLPKT